MEQNNIHKKSVNNAISAYFMVLISVFFLFNKKNEFINNNFVKSHTKVAFLIHLSFLATYIIFINYSFLKEISFLGYNLNYILASSIFIILFIYLLYGIYKASRSINFKIGDLMKIGNTQKILDINGDGKLDEKDKLTLILSYIPFLGYFIQGEYYKNKSVSEIIKFNLIVSSFISLIYISGNKDITLLFILFYIIFAVFSSINIIIRETIIGINLHFIPTPREIIDNSKIFSKYLLNYLSKNKFLTLSKIKTDFYSKKEKIEKLNKNNVTINFIMLVIFIIIFTVLIFYGFIPNNSYIILFFPLSFLLGYLKSRPNYKIPFIYDLFEILVYIKNIFKKTKKVIKEKQAEVHSETIKVSEIKK